RLAALAVPREPTSAMIDACGGIDDKNGWEYGVEMMWKRMYDAAPKAQQPPAPPLPSGGMASWNPPEQGDAPSASGDDAELCRLLLQRYADVGDTTARKAADRIAALSAQQRARGRMRSGIGGCG